MCLGVPGLVVQVDDLTALVDFWGVRRRVRLDLVDEPVAVGDYVLNHVGFAIRRIPPGDVQTTLDMYEQLLKSANRDDLMAANVRGEIEAAGGDARLKPRAPSGHSTDGARAFSRTETDGARGDGVPAARTLRGGVSFSRAAGGDD
jgi:hydrogenase expression/formation protein HypC